MPKMIRDWFSEDVAGKLRDVSGKGWPERILQPGFIGFLRVFLIPPEFCQAPESGIPAKQIA
jgi:hypothetical protein